MLVDKKLYLLREEEDALEEKYCSECQKPFCAFCDTEVRAMSKLKPLYVYCHYETDNVRIPVTIMYSEIQTFETDALLDKIAEDLESKFDHYFQERGNHNA